MTTKNTGKALAQIEKISGEKLTLGRLIWAIRSSEELNQTEFCKKLNISKQQLCDIEHNRKGISPKQAAAYAEMLGHSPQQFVRLALQNTIDKADLAMVVKIEPKKSGFNDYHLIPAF